MSFLREQSIENFDRPNSGNRITYDDVVKGFGVRVTASGAKSFILNYRVNGRERRITIGSYPDWTLDAARNQAKVLKRKIDLGNDPLEEKNKLTEAPWKKALPNKAENENNKKIVETLDMHFPETLILIESMISGESLELNKETKKEVTLKDINMLTGKLNQHKLCEITTPGRYGDGGGLWLQVRKPDPKKKKPVIALSKSWLFRYAWQGKQRVIGLGPHPDVELLEARALAQIARRNLRDGKDPTSKQFLKSQM